MFIIRKRKQGGTPAPDISVTLNIIGFIRREYANISCELRTPEGSSIRQVLKMARDQGLVEKHVYRFAVRMRPPVSLIINGGNVALDAVPAYRASHGDTITLYTPLSGG